MRQLQPVLWTKGVLLSPQHLQTQDRFLEDVLEFQLSNLMAFPWGISRLDVDREALAGGAFALSSAAGILPDGLMFDCPSADPVPAPRPLDDCWEPDQQALDVFLAIPEYRPGGYNVSAGSRDRNTRYTAEVLLRRDENTGLTEKPIQVARKNLRLLTQGESLEGSSSLRVARVLRSPTGGYQLDPRFVPPVVDISASEYLLSIARRLVEILTAKSSTLAGGRRQKNQSLAEFSIADVASFWLLYTVNGHLPQFRHLFEVRRGHPLQLYHAMLALAGSLSTFSTKIQPRQLPSYNHEDLSGCFGDLDAKLRELLETVVPSNCVTLPLRQVQPLIYATAIDQERYLQAVQMYLAVSADANQADLLRKTPQLLKLSSHDEVERLIRQALPGVGLAYVQTPPSAVPVKLSHHYFQLNRAGPEWDAVVRARNLAAYVPAEVQNAQMELVIVLPAER
ncbi:MAG TPA: type VI secretion system baseplate subunit TssK [Gemmatimonadales bacterium]|jgi:type VI secretion system protein ImpJ|nr:type VI secretion system baseplate subunit TssK [Gemmatimonadales bacterium]